jgi:type II secretory pathway pseudopilin PulG
MATLQMKTSPAKGASLRAFALIDLLVVVVILAALAAVFSTIPERLREQTYLSIDQSNLRQILRASALYANENDDHLAHPTWGTVPSGPDGWAYITFNNGRIPGAPSIISSCEGSDLNTPQFTNQLKFFRFGQVTQYLPDVRTAWCPKDVATRNANFRSRILWLSRHVKVTSYQWNGTIGAHVGRAGQNVPWGKTYKLSDFRPNDWQMWEGFENERFSFNDAADNPEQVDIISRRHSRRGSGFDVPRNSPGGAPIGRFDGSAPSVRWSKVFDLTIRRTLPPNELLNGPGYR